ncbi:reverse transcriptase [Phytophthora megakarya]|uniref:Reverse transcriptase n=1 Tax=Phytophthora megakarya TaxID=4795 RepID=A0A225VHB3_9STRA|nr:reverse transcriptase [Phytophthora megakarya]
MDTIRCVVKPKDVEFTFAIRPKTEKGANEEQGTIKLDSYQENPAYSILLKHHGVFQQKLPSSLPSRDHGEHQMEIDTSEAIFRRQWRQSPAQEQVIRALIEEMLAAGLIRPSPSQHGAPTFCVKKAVGWRIVHDYRAMNSHTVRRTLPMPHKDTIIEKMQGSHWYSCMDLLSGYYQFCMRDSDVPLTAFQTADGAYEYLVLPMGLSNAPATFNTRIQRTISI